MHALVASVLARTAWPDALDGNTKPEPKDRKPGEIVKALGGSAAMPAPQSHRPGDALHYRGEPERAIEAMLEMRHLDPVFTHSWY